ncbi:MAG: hypothetical protein AAF990_16490 [Bacteroidota bacterium]
MNYEELREQGIRNIQQLAPKTWTDHNTHDPGITILELLSYAITDLGHRTDYAFRDLLAEDFDKLSPLVHSDYDIRQILPCNPVTLNDWRKLLIDLSAVRNAWIRPSSPQAPDLYNHYPEDTDNDEGSLTFTDGPAGGFVQDEIHIKGLYEVYLELQEDKTLGDLNSPSIFKTIALDLGSGLRDYRLEFIFPRWSDLQREWLADWNLVSATLEDIDETTDESDYLVTLTVTTDAGVLDVIEIIVFFRPGLEDGDDTNILETAIENLVTDTAADALIDFYHQKILQTDLLLKDAKQKLLNHRNHCEDFLKVDLICYQEIALHGDIIVQQGADPNKISAVIYFLIDQFLSPLIPFRTLDEMKALGYTIDQLFSGPLLKSGFLHEDDFDGPLLESDYLDDKTIRALVRNAVGSTNGDELIIYTSDLIRIIMCLKKELGIIAVRNFSISSYMDNVLQSEDVKDCLLLQNANACKPKLSINKSINSLNIQTESMTVIGEDESLEVNLSQILLDVDTQKNKLSQDLSQDELTTLGIQLTPEAGKSRHISNYYSMQGDFPLTYGIGRSGLPPTVPKSRRAKARQLKAYLLFFEQFLANYQAQLGHLKELFSIDRRVEQTYFAQSLYNVPDAYLLLKDFVDDHPNDIDKYKLIEADWTTFKDNLNNYYVKKIQQWIEKPKVYLDRRNRFLDFLLARFGEDFTDYSALRYFVNQNNIEKELIDCKIGLLESVPLISRDRGRAFNYCHRADDGTPAAWVAYNQSGYRLRLTKLLGLKDNVEIYPEADADGIDEFRFRIRNSMGDILLSSSQNYKSHELDLMHEHIRTVRTLAADIANYELKITIGGQFYFNIIDNGGDVLARRIQYFNTEPERTVAINEVLAQMGNAERFHYIEHVLLRPKSTSDPLMATKQVKLTGIKDPYSFGCSIVFPAFLPPFDNLLFRSYAERIVYLETPAHNMAEIYWVEDQGQFDNFEAAYHAWLDLGAQVAPSNQAAFDAWQTDIRNALDTLIQALDVIRTA